MIVRHEQINERGEGSRPRVDLIALGELLDRAALGIDSLARCLKAMGLDPGPAPRILHDHLINALREVRSVRTRSKRRVRCDRTRS